MVFPSTTFEQLKGQLLDTNDPREHCAILFAHRSRTTDGWRFLVTRAIVAPPESFLIRKRHAAVLDPDFIANLTKQARKTGQSLVFVHTHPDSEHPSFSHIDDDGEQHLVQFLQKRLGDFPNAAMVIGRSSCRARVLGSVGQPLSVVQVATMVEKKDLAENDADLAGTYDRQVRAFGEEGQRIIQGLCVGVVGLGGTGSIVVDMLARLGVHKFVLIDPDTVEQSNLNRLIGGNEKSLGRPKVQVAREHITDILPFTPEITVIQGSILDETAVSALKSSDFLFGCTDSHGSRVVLNQFAYQHLIPYIDLGVGIATDHGVVKNITGRVQYLAPGFGCLVCSGQMDYDAVRREFMNEEHRSADPYFVGNGVPQPSVVSINATVSSLAVTMFLSVITGIPSNPRYLVYNGIEGRTRSVSAAQDPICLVCSPRGSLAKGDSMALPVRLS